MRLFLLPATAIAAFCQQPVLTPVPADPAMIRGQMTRPGGPQQPQAAAIDLKPEDYCTVSGKVTSALTGEPLKKAQLSLIPAAPNPGRPFQPLVTTTDSTGKFAMKDVEPGRYRMNVQKNGFAMTEYGARQANRPGTTLTLNKGQKIADVNFALTPAGVISGRVVDEDGEPMMGVQINALRYSYRTGAKQLMPFSIGATDDRGIFRMHSIPPGKYYVNAVSRMDVAWGMDRTAGNRPDEGYASTFYPGTSDPASAVMFDVAPGAEIQNVEIRLLKTTTARVRGKITGSNPNIIGVRTNVSLIPKVSQGLMTQFGRGAPVDEKGNFEIRGVAPGSYFVRAEQLEEGRRLIGQTTVEVGEGNVEGVTVNMAPGVQLPGVIKVAQGQADLTKSHVYLRPKDLPMMGTSGGRVKEDGTFDIQNVYAGSFEVGVVGLPEDLYVKSIRYGQEDALTRPVDLQQGAAGALEITVQTGAGKLAGPVLNDKKEPALGATVVLQPNAANSYRRDLYKMITTDQNGTYALTGIAPGDYRVYAFEEIEQGAHQDADYLKEFERLAEKVTIGEKESKTLQLTLISAAKAATGQTQ